MPTGRSRGGQKGGCVAVDFELINGTDKRLGDELRKALAGATRVSFVSKCFSLPAFDALKPELKKIKEFRFLFSLPTFTAPATVSEKGEKERREFFIPKLHRENALFNSEFEIKLRNKLGQRAVARECAKWIREKAKFRSQTSSDAEALQDFATVENAETGTVLFSPFREFTLAGLNFEFGAGRPSAFVCKIGEAGMISQFLARFDSVWNDAELTQDVTDAVCAQIGNAYRENEPEFVFFLTLFYIFQEFADELNPDDMPNPALGYKNSLIWKKLFDFQQDGAVAVINKLERYNGCILADSVGLGKTFTALAVIKYYGARNKSVLVLCPKKLSANWLNYLHNNKTNPFFADKLNYAVLYHTDVQRERGTSGNGIDLAKINWGGFDLIVIDESHNFRNSGAEYQGRETRYQTLMRKAIRDGVNTKVLMLSATPVNNRFGDLKSQLALAYGNDSSKLSARLKNEENIEKIFRKAETTFNRWSGLADEERTRERLVEMLPPSFIELLDAVTVARSRSHIQRFYDVDKLGAFPQHRPTVKLDPPICADPNVVSIKELYALFQEIKFSVYTPLQFVRAEFKPGYDEKYQTNMASARTFTQSVREFTLKKLMIINVLKRLESSVHSFRATLEKIREKNQKMLADLDSPTGTISYGKKRWKQVAASLGEEDEFDDAEATTLGDGEIVIEVAHLDVPLFRQVLEADGKRLDEILEKIAPIVPAKDEKLNTLRKIILEKAKKPFNGGNKKVIVFSAYSDTVDYLYGQLAPSMVAEGLHCAKITGDNAKTTLRGKDFDFEKILAFFSPRSKERDKIYPNEPGEIEILFATDCISEGQNLQDCDYLVNYDIHWNPVRIIQRFGRVDRIGSQNKEIQLVNFWPAIALEDYLHLQSRVLNKMVGVEIANGDGALERLEKEEGFSAEAFRRMQEGEKLDLEDLKTGVSITDLGLNEYVYALQKYRETHPRLDRAPRGIHAVVGTDPARGLVPGVIFVLRNRDKRIRENADNYFHPFYLAYVDMAGTPLKNFSQGKEILELLRLSCIGKDKPLVPLCAAFNKETDDGAKMERYSKLLSEAIRTLGEHRAVKAQEALFTRADTEVPCGNEPATWSDDSFELVAFFVVRQDDAQRDNAPAV